MSDNTVVSLVAMGLIFIFLTTALFVPKKVFYKSKKREVCIDRESRKG